MQGGKGGLRPAGICWAPRSKQGRNGQRGPRCFQRDRGREPGGQTGRRGSLGRGNPWEGASCVWGEGVDLRKGRVQAELGAGDCIRVQAATGWPGTLGTPWGDATLSGGHLTRCDKGRPRAPNSTDWSQDSSQPWLCADFQGLRSFWNLPPIPATRSRLSPLLFTHIPHDQHLPQVTLLILSCCPRVRLGVEW